MSVADLLPPIPRPPHDPSFTMLGGRMGWGEASRWQTTIEPTTGAIMLSRLPGADLPFADPALSLGHLVLPANVAVTGDGSVWLLDRSTHELKRFDSCACRFENIRPLAGMAIAFCAGNLYVADPAGRRVIVLALSAGTIRDIWSAPSQTAPVASVLPGTEPAHPNMAGPRSEVGQALGRSRPFSALNPWRPIALAINGQGRVFVADPDNGGIHRFRIDGRWELFFPGLGAVSQIGIDCLDRIYVVRDEQPGALILDAEGTTIGSADSPQDISGRFARLPFAIDAQGRLDLGRLCHWPAAAIFDLGGKPVVAANAPLKPTLFNNGYFISGPLDSRVYRCQWHRVVLRGEASRSGRIRISTFTSEAVLPQDHLVLPGIAWQTHPAPATVFDKEWDCLIPSPPGRYLWIRFTFESDGFTSPVIDEARLEFPRVPLRRYLPGVFGAEPVSADFTDRFLANFDTTLRSIETQIDNEAGLFDPLSSPAAIDPNTGVDFLSWLASWVGVQLERQWPERKRRAWLKGSASLFRLRGTRIGLYRQLLLLLDLNAAQDRCPFECGTPGRCIPKPLNCAPPECCNPWQPPPLILEHFQLRRWLYAGVGRLGDQAVLWGQSIVNRSQLGAGARAGGTQLIVSKDPLHDPFHVTAHRYSVFVPGCYGKSDARRRSLINVLRSESPAHVQYQLEFVEPRFRIGFQSSIGFNTVVGRYPAGIELDSTVLGRGSVVPEAPGRRRGPSISVGSEARIGSTTLLT